MKVQAISKNIKISPRKVRLVADSVKKQELTQALAYLTLMNKRAARPIKKTIESAIANAVNNASLNRGDLMLSEIVVGEGIAYKRYHYAARGRIRPYQRRSSHITVILETKATAAVPVKADSKVEANEKAIDAKESAVEVKEAKTETVKPKRGLLGRMKKDKKETKKEESK